MNTFLKAVWGVLLLATITAGANAQEGVPYVDDTSFQWWIARNLNTDPAQNFYLVEQDLIADFVPFDPVNDIAHEYDYMLMTFDITDPDWELNEEGAVEDPEDVYYYIEAFWIPASPSSQDPSPIDAPTYAFRGSTGPVDTFTLTRTVSRVFQIPPYLGQNQDILRGNLDFNGYWSMVIYVSNNEEPDFTGLRADPEVSIGVPGDFRVKKHPANLLPNAPPVADAGGDMSRVDVGDLVVLDASRTFDPFNVGFDPTNPNVFAKDVLTYTWDWVSGPAYVEPRQLTDQTPFATAELVVSSEVADPDTGEIAIVPYVFRVTVSDNFNDTISSDLVEIIVRDAADNLPPRARANRIAPPPSEDIVVGDTIVLSAAESTDGDNPPDPLTYRWRQTDELGNSIAPEDVDRLLQPVSGIESEEITWQATTPGTYHFQLIVTDGVDTDTTSISITITENTETASVSAVQSDSGDASDETLNTLNPMGICGTGATLTMWAVPLGLMLLRRRHA